LGLIPVWSGYWNRFVDPLFQLATRLPTLGCTTPGYRVVQMVTRNHKSLTPLHLGELLHLEGPELLAAVMSCSNLETLSSGFADLEHLKRICAASPKLQHLRLSSCPDGSLDILCHRHQPEFPLLSLSVKYQCDVGLIRADHLHKLNIVPRSWSEVRSGFVSSMPVTDFVDGDPVSRGALGLPISKGAPGVADAPDSRLECEAVPVQHIVAQARQSTNQNVAPHLFGTRSCGPA
jgi:hypothetical protein